jgi:hypothetical protein
MELKQTKVFLPTDENADSITSVFKSHENITTLEKEGYFLTKEELERVIGDAFEAGELHNENKKDIFYTQASTMYKGLKQYIKQILK